MNERIKELKQQAEKTYTWKDFSPDGYEVTKQEKTVDLEKFAELIVRECAGVCLAQRDPANLNYKPSEKFAEAVKQHFGVKE
jgi:hypothetical protein